MIKAHVPDPRKDGNDGSSYLFMFCIGPVWKDDVDEVDERQDERRPHSIAVTGTAVLGGRFCGFTGNLL